MQRKQTQKSLAKNHHFTDFVSLKKALDFHYHAHNSQNAINRENLDPLLKVKEYINGILDTKTQNLQITKGAQNLQSLPQSQTLQTLQKSQKLQMLQNLPATKSTTNATQISKSKIHNIPYIALICALFAYGNVRAILRFLDSLDFSLLDSREGILASDFPYYRFQNSTEVKLFFLALCEMREQNTLESLLEKRDKSAPIYCFINDCIKTIWQAASKWANKLDYALPPHNQSDLGKNHFNGFAFLVGTPLSNKAKLPSSPLKRWNMFLRWLVRSDNIDLGLWGESIKKSELLLPLDTHTFSVCRSLGLLERKSYDFRAVLEVSQNLALFDENDPIKYDFALYRLGQKGIIKKGEKVDFLCQ
ncbi:TIGR02757 family protein [Helicobacter sp. T3_23-1056]